jgi:hypothetical protein
MIAVLAAPSAEGPDKRPEAPSLRHSLPLIRRAGPSPAFSTGMMKLFFVSAMKA